MKRNPCQNRLYSLCLSPLMPSEVVFYKTARRGLRHFSLNRASERIRRIKTYLLSWICISYMHRRTRLSVTLRVSRSRSFWIKCSFAVSQSGSIVWPAPAAGPTQSHIAAVDQAKIHKHLCIEPEGVLNNLHKMKEKQKWLFVHEPDLGLWNWSNPSFVGRWEMQRCTINNH